MPRCGGKISPARPYVTRRTAPSTCPARPCGWKLAASAAAASSRRWHMRSLLILAFPALLSGVSVQACSVAKGLYSAVVLKSGVPSRADRALMEVRQNELLRDLPLKRVVILPVAVLDQKPQPDTLAAIAIAQALRSNG